MAFKPTTTRKAARSGGLKCVVYGDAKVGKTTLAATTPNPEKETLIISAEQGMLSLRDYDIPVAEIADWPGLEEVLDYLETDHPFKWVIVDSLTEIADMHLRELLAGAKDPRKAYGTLYDDVVRVIRRLRDAIKANVLLICEATSYETETGRVGWRPQMPGNSLKDKVPYAMDEVFAMRLKRDESGKTFRALQTQPDGLWMAGDRSGALDPIEQPNLTHIQRKIMEDPKNG